MNMNYTNSNMKRFILYIWQLPQNLAGLIVLAANLHNFEKHEDGYYTVKRLEDRAVSLGDYIIFDSDKRVTQTKIKHERGHQKQSLYFGWLYLIVIGIPISIKSLFVNC